MVDRRHGRQERRNVTLQLVCGQAKQNLSFALQKLSKEAFRCTTVASRLDEEIDHVAVLIDGPPQILSLTVDRDEDLVPAPCISESTLSSFQTPDIVETKLRAPPANGLIGHDDPSLGDQILDISEADTESVLKPDRMTDDFGWIAVSVVAGLRAFYPIIVAGIASNSLLRRSRSVNLSQRIGVVYLDFSAPRWSVVDADLSEQVNNV
jgi:hypothetical protein